ncbi:RNA polymerase sigma factor [Neolewinella lacunae]|uniref:RNA polymerase sigma factor n=1 Tax=Neolewinella lacunae TaxID=1517758 RepID=A0A923T7J0_9BACT|nr:RNA polymerase sigma factor [Neolewinella lacunae]MBC6993596.1 RNA polymerase sigma factor [Neolewinella lacunae]MDN3633472.1 RNA polymerase sigma factor [Neolewinella lacunae]
MPKQHPNIGELIAQCLAGQRLAQRQLYEQHLPYALTVTRRFGVASRSTADVVQEIFTEVFSHLAHFDAAKGSFLTWLRTIAVRKTIDFLRKRENLNFTELVAILPERAPTEELQLDHIPTDELLLAMNNLPAGFRTIFNLYAVDGYKHTEIAEMLGISASASRSQYARARERLQKHLQATKKKMTHDYE